MKAPRPALRARRDLALSAAASRSREAVQLGVRVAEHRRIIEHDDRAQIGQPIGDRQDLVDIFLVFGDEDAGAAVAHLVLDLGRRRGRIDAVDDGAERLRGEVADHPLFADVAHDGDALAAFDAERLQRARRMRAPARRSRASAARDRCRNAWSGRRPNPASLRARSHSRCGAVVRRSLSRSTVQTRSSCALSRAASVRIL